MKRNFKRALSLLLTLAMCMGLLPVNVLAAAGGNPDPGETPALTIQGTPMLVKGDYQYAASDRTPFLSVEWSNGITLPDTYGAEVSVWAGTDTTRPENYWYDNTIDCTGSSGSFYGRLSKYGSSDPAQIFSDCMVMVELSYNGATYTATQQGVATVQGGTGYQAPVTVTVSGTPTLSGSSGSPSLSVSWNYDKTLTGDFSGMVYAWKDDGNNGALPSNHYWFQEYTNGDGGTGDSATVALQKQGSPEALEGDCWVLVSLGLSAQAIVNAEPVMVTFGSGSSGGGSGGGTNEHLPTPSDKLPVIEQVTYYDKDYSYLLSYPDTYHGYPAAWYLYAEGSNNLEVFALLPAASQAAAESAGIAGYKGFQVSGQWYSVAGLWTVNPSKDIMDKDGTHRALMTPLYCNSVPAQDTTLYLALWDYDNKGLSNLVPVTVPAAGETANATGQATLSIGTASLEDATVGQAYTATLSGSAANGGALSWSVSSGALPAGLTLSGGTISGTPTTVGSSTFELTLTEAGSGGGSVKQTFTLKVGNPAPKITIAPTLPNATKGIPYTIPLKGTASGGGTLSWSVKSGSTLPDGLALAADGTLSGTPTTTGNYSFAVELAETDVAGKAAQTFSLAVKEPKRYTVSYVLNGGEAAPGSDVTAATLTESAAEDWKKLTLPAAPAKVGYDFDGWRWAGTSYAAGASVTVTGNMTFIAQWKEKAPVKVTYSGQIVGSCDLRGTTAASGSVYLWSGYADRPATVSDMEISWYYLRSYTLTSLGLWAYVDGTYQEIATYSGDPAEAGTTIALTRKAGMDDLSVVTDVTVNGGALTRNTDYRVNYLYRDNRAMYLPFMTTHTDGFSVSISGISSSENYSKYKWRTYDDVTVSGGVAAVTLEEIPAGVTVSGTVTYGSGASAEPLAGVQVQFSQYAYNQNLSFSATTAADGTYTVTGLQPEGYAYYSVLSGGQRLVNEQSYFVPAANATNDIAVQSGVALLDLSVDTSGSNMTQSQRNIALANIRNGISVEFKQNSSVLARYRYPSLGGNTYNLPGAATGSVDYTISGAGVMEQSGSIALTNGVGMASVVLTPAPAVVVTLSSPNYCQYALAWFSGESFQGVSKAFYVGSGGNSVYATSPNGAGTYTVALVPYTAVGVLSGDTTLSSLGKDIKLKTWSVTLDEHEIGALANYEIDKAVSENAAYVTKPNSTLTAEKEAFASTNDLIRFTGSIGLDSGMKNGTLRYLKINPRNEVDNVSYSNTAPIQYVVIGGKKYDANGGANGFSMANTGYYWKDSLDIKLPCEYTIYCKPGSVDWDMQLSVYANVTCDGNGDFSNQLIGSATVKKPGASITTLSSHVCSDTIAVKGTTVSNGKVDIYDGEALVATATANAKGLWEAKVTLAGVDSTYATTHLLTSRAANGARSDDLYVFHDPNGPELTSFRMSWSRNPDGIDVGDGYVYAGSMSDLTFTAKFKNPNKLRATVYGSADESAKVAFVYYLTNGTVGFIQATSGDGSASNPFKATLDKTLYSSVTAAEVIYDPILNQRPVSEGGVYALSDTDLANAAGELDATCDSIATIIQGESFAATPEQLETINQAASGSGMEMISCALDFNDTTDMIGWMNQSADDWAAVNNKTGKVGVYSKSIAYQNKADYTEQIDRLSQNADRKALLENSDSTVTGGQFVFTDIKRDADGNITDEGTYLAEFDVYSDTARKLYVINAALMLKDSFTGYASGLPTLAMARAIFGDGWWDYWTSSKSNVSTTEKAIRNYVDEKAWSTPISNNQFDAAKGAFDLYKNSKEHINYNANSEMQVMQNRIDMNMVMNSKEMKEINNYKSYLQDIHSVSNNTLLSSNEGLDRPPTILDRLNQMQKDFDAMRADDGSSAAENFKFGLDTMRSLEAIAGAGDLDNAPNPAKMLKDGLLDVTGIVCDKLALDKQLERLNLYNRFMENWNYIQNWYDQNYGFGYDKENELFAKWLKEHNGGAGGGTGGAGATQDDTNKASSSRAKEMADQNKTRKPPITNKVSNDPAGVIFEGVIENPVEGATVTLYYAATGGGDVVLKTDSPVAATQLLRADDVDDLIPDNPVQTTGVDGKYSWGVPEGLWYVSAQRGGITNDSQGDREANVAHSGLTFGSDTVTKLLPVLPVQLDVNIPLVDTTPPVVTDVVFAEGEGVYVTFSKYMKEGDGDDSCLKTANYTLNVGGAAKDLTVTSFERGSTPANLNNGAVTHYTKTVLLHYADLAAGDTVNLTVNGAIRSYADTPIGADYTTGDSTVEVQVQLGKPSVKVGSTNAAVTADTATVERGDALILTLPTDSPASAKIVYQIDDGTETTYTAPIAVNSDFALKAWCEAPGYTTSEVITIAVKTSPENNGNSGSGGNSGNGGNSGGSGGSTSSGGGDKTGVGSIETTAKVSGGKAQASVSASSAAAALKNAKAGDTLTVKVDTGKADDVSVTLPAKTVQTAADAKVDVRVETGNGAVTLDTATVKALADSGKDASVGVTKNADGTTTVNVTSGGGSVDARLKVALPAAAGGETLMLVNADGSTTPVKKSIVENGVVYAEIPAGATVKVASAAKSFPDVPAGAWYAKSVKFVTSHGLFQGTDMGFEPDATMTRAMLATVLYRLEDGRSVGKNRFTDVPDGQWFTEAVIWADSAGIVNGTAGTQFSPDEPVTREQIATMLYRYAKAIGLDTTGRAELNGFSDGGKTASWASEAMQWAVSADLFKGDANGALNPGGKATRAEVATLLQRMVALMVK